VPATGGWHNRLCNVYNDPAADRDGLRSFFRLLEDEFLFSHDDGIGGTDL
jgi:hypothetical protein